MSKLLILFIVLMISGCIQDKSERVYEYDSRDDFSREYKRASAKRQDVTTHIKAKQKSTGKYRQVKTVPKDTFKYSTSTPKRKR